MTLKNFKELGDNLTINEFNGVINLFRHFKKHYDYIKLNNEIKGEFGDYLFDFNDLIILDNGIKGIDGDSERNPKVKLLNPLFKFSSYTLKLKVFYTEEVNILDDLPITDYVRVVEFEIPLEVDNWVDINVFNYESGGIISLDAIIEIKHDKTEIHYIKDLSVNVEPNPVMVDENTDIKACLIDYNGEPYNLIDGRSKKVYFYEVLTPTISLSADKLVIQDSAKTNISALLKDEDGSIVYNSRIDFYEVFNPVLNARADTDTIVSGDTVDIYSDLVDEDGSNIDGEKVYFYKRVE